MRCGHKFHLDCVQHTHKIADMCVICWEEADFVKIVKVQDYDDLELKTNEDEDEVIVDLFGDDRQSLRKSIDDNVEIQQQQQQQQQQQKRLR